MPDPRDMAAYKEAQKIHSESEFVSNERMDQHGGIITEYTRLAKIWSVLLGIEISPELAVIMMATHKANRIACGARDYRDHYLDGSNYFALAWGVRHVLNKEDPPDDPAEDFRGTGTLRCSDDSLFNGA